MAEMISQAPQGPSPASGDTESKKFPYAAVFLTILAFLLLCASSYFIYQNRRLSHPAVPVNPEPPPTSQITPTSSPDPTADWKTYSNSTYNFSFKYPQGATYKNTNYTGSKASITFSRLTTFQNTDMTVFIGNSWAFTNPKADKVVNATVSGSPAYREDLPMGQNPPQTTVYVRHGSEYITIQLVKDDKDTEIDRVFEAIIRSFTFKSTP